MAGFDWNKFIQSREAKATGISIGTALAAKLLGLGWGGSLATGAIAGGGYWGLDKFLEPKIKEVDKVPEWVDNEDKYNMWRSQNDSERMLLERAQADYAQEMKAQRKAKKSAPAPYKNPFAERNAGELAAEYSAKNWHDYRVAVRDRALRWAGYDSKGAYTRPLVAIDDDLNVSPFEKQLKLRQHTQSFIDDYKRMAMLRGHRISFPERLALEQALGYSREYSHDKSAPSFFTEYNRPNNLSDSLDGLEESSWQ